MKSLLFLAVVLGVPSGADSQEDLDAEMERVAEKILPEGAGKTLADLMRSDAGRVIVKQRIAELAAKDLERIQQDPLKSYVEYFFTEDAHGKLHLRPEPLGFARGETGLPGIQIIDRRIQEKWDKLGLKPGPAASDEEFLRRVRLDLTGAVPSAEEAEGFLKDPDPRKRERKVEELLGSRTQARYWSQLWTVSLVGWFKKNYYYSYEKESLREWLEEQFHRNVPWTRIGQALLSASGDKGTNRAVNFALAYLEHDGPEAMTNQVSRVFLGYRLQCAQCHDHKFDKWTQEDFYGVASFFARATKQSQYTSKVQDRLTGDALTPQGWPAPVPPQFINGFRPQTPLWRQELALAVTRHPQFAKTFVNRAWTFLMGRGIVHPPDNFSAKNPPSHPELLEELAQDFAAHGYDIRYLLRCIANSKAYQLSSKSVGFDPAHKRYFVHAIPKLLSPYQVFSSLAQATGLDKKYREDQDPLEREPFLEQYAGGLSSDASDSNSYVETSQDVLTKLTGDFLAAFKASGEGALLPKLLAAPLDRRIELLYLGLLGRNPREKELRTCREHMASGESQDPAQAIRDLFYMLVNSDEFNFNH